MSEAQMHRQAGRQRAIRQTSAALAGKLTFLAQDAERVGLEGPSIAALTAAAEALKARFGATPFVVRKPRGDDNA